ncbi:MAG: phage holin [Eubacteriales bacterium]|nr:phage holin [Eubacteriales bacterium]
MKVSTGTITRTVILALALVNQILTMAGYSPIPIADETVTELIATSATVITALIAFWKNNSFTQAALRGDEVMKSLK